MEIKPKCNQCKIWPEARNKQRRNVIGSLAESVELFRNKEKKHKIINSIA